MPRALAIRGSAHDIGIVSAEMRKLVAAAYAALIITLIVVDQTTGLEGVLPGLLIDVVRSNAPVLAAAVIWLWEEEVPLSFVLASFLPASAASMLGYFILPSPLRELTIAIATIFLASLTVSERAVVLWIRCFPRSVQQRWYSNGG